MARTEVFRNIDQDDVVARLLQPAAVNSAHSACCNTHRVWGLLRSSKIRTGRQDRRCAPALINVRLSAIVSACKANVKHDGMIGSMLEAVTIERKKLFQQVAAHLERLILTAG